MEMSVALSWEFTQGREVIPYRRFGIIYRSHFKSKTFQEFGKELPFYAA